MLATTHAKSTGLRNSGRGYNKWLYVVEDGHAVACEDSHDDEFGEMDPIIPGDGKEEVRLNFNDDLMDGVEFKKDEHFNQLDDVDACPVDLHEIR